MSCFDQIYSHIYYAEMPRLQFETHSFVQSAKKKGFEYLRKINLCAIV